MAMVVTGEGEEGEGGDLEEEEGEEGLGVMVEVSVPCVSENLALTL